MLNIPGKKFIGIYTLILKKGLHKKKAQFISVFIFDTLSFITQGGVIAILALIIEHINSDKIDALIGFHIIKLISQLTTLSQSNTLLALGILISTFISIFSVSFRYKSSLIARKLARELHIQLIRQTITINFKQKNLYTLGQSKNPEEVSKAILQHSLHAGNSLEVLLRIPQIIVYFFILLSAAFFINSFITLVIIILMMLMLPFFSALSKKIHSSSSVFFNKNAVEFNKRASELINDYDNFYSKKFQQVSKNNIEDWEETDQYFNSYDDIQLANAKMTFRTGLIKSIVFSSGLIMIAYWVITTESALYTIITYAGALFIAFGYIQMFFSYFVSLNLFYPQVNRQLNLINQENLSDKNNEPKFPIEIQESSHLLLGSNPKTSNFNTQLALGDCVDLIFQGNIQRLTIGTWLSPLGDRINYKKELMSNACFFTSSMRINTIDFKSQLNTDKKFQIIFNFFIKQTLSQQLLEDELKQTNQYITNPIISAITKLAIAYTSDDSTFTILEHSMLSMFSNETIDAIKNKFNDKVLLILRTPQNEPITNLNPLFSVVVEQQKAYIFKPNDHEKITVYFSEYKGSSSRIKTQSNSEVILTI